MMTNLQKSAEVRGTTDGGGVVLRDVWVVATAAFAVLVTWALWTRVGDVHLAVRSGDGDREVGAGAATVTAVVVSVAGALLARLLSRRAEDGLRWWTVIACATWLLSMVGPLGATSLPAGVGLASLHLVVGAVVIFGVRRAHAGESA